MHGADAPSCGKQTLHSHAATGFKTAGQHVDLHGQEDSLICREAGTFWNEQTTDGYNTMRARLDVELAAVAEEIDDGGLSWSLRNVKRLITPYPARSDVDRILANLGEDYNHDDLEALGNEDAETAVAGNDKEAIDTDSEATTDSENLETQKVMQLTKPPWN